jgi:ribokinase
MLTFGQVIMNPAPAQKLPEDLYQYIDCLIMNESEADILREAKEDLKDEDLPQICEAFFKRGVPDMVVITLGAKVRESRIPQGTTLTIS